MHAASNLLYAVVSLLWLLLVTRGFSHTSTPTSSFAPQGKYADAEALLKSSLDIQEKALGPNHPEVATSLNEMAGLFEAQVRVATPPPPCNLPSTFNKAC